MTESSQKFFSWPSRWRSFVAKNALVGAEVAVPIAPDDGDFAELCLFSEEQARIEIERDDLYQQLFSCGFVPIGICLLGTGNLYYIKLDERDSTVYCVDNEIDLSKLPGESASIEKVVPDYRMLLMHVIAPGA